MDRRELLAWIAAVTGCAFVGGREALALDPPAPAAPGFDAGDVSLLDEVAETLLPRTDTPGAKDAAVGAFIALYATARYEPAALATLRSGLVEIEARSREKYSAGFRDLKVAQREELLAAIDEEARRPAREAGAQPHYFTLLRQLALLGFFTSEPGATRVARYRPVPGAYRGCIPWHAGETFWS
jgi:hypothetical protein